MCLCVCVCCGCVSAYVLPSAQHHTSTQHACAPQQPDYKVHSISENPFYFVRAVHSNRSLYFSYNFLRVCLLLSLYSHLLRTSVKKWLRLRVWISWMSAKCVCVIFSATVVRWCRILLDLRSDHSNVAYLFLRARYVCFILHWRARARALQQNARKQTWQKYYTLCISRELLIYT